MAKPEQTEKATPKRLDEARKRGQVAKSSELAGAAVFLAGVFVLHAMAPATLHAFDRTMAVILANTRMHEAPTPSSVWMMYAQTVGSMGLVLLVLFGTALVVGVGVNVAQVGFLFTLKPIAPSFSKINPISGITRLFSKQVAVNLGKQVLKLLAVAVIMYTSLVGNMGALFNTSQMSPDYLLGFVGGLIYDIGWKFGFLLLIVALLDLAYMRWQFQENMKMSKQEVKDEARQADGSPEIKGAVKRRQRESARRRMMASVPKATVVVTNPTHFAVALEWDELKMDAPVVTAKGADLVAKRIREIAQQYGVPIMENAPLARTLYAKVELDQAIPPNLYAAVAQVIAFVFKLKRKTIA